MNSIRLLIKARSVLLVSLFLLLLTTLSSCGSSVDSYVKIAGPTMGTRYHITAKLPQGSEQKALEQAINQRLIAINQSMSTYIPDSEISLFNQMRLNQSMDVSDDFITVLKISQQVYIDSEFAFNPMIGPLVDLWGFGPVLSLDHFQKKPSDSDIQLMLSQVDFNALELQGSTLKKSKTMRLDFSAVAKGYAVDEIAALLMKAGVANFMVEIGGEVKTQGLSPRQSPWRIGIEQPSALNAKTFKALELKDTAVATSGDYRNYLEIDGKRYSHTIDPTSGYPVDHQLSSVTVIAADVASADAWATAIMVLGQDKGFRIAKKHDLAVYMIYRDNDDYAVKYTQAMQRYLAH